MTCSIKHNRNACPPSPGMAPTTFLASHAGPVCPRPASLVCFLLSAYCVPGTLSGPSFNDSLRSHGSSVTVGSMTSWLAQSHPPVEPGCECHSFASVPRTLSSCCLEVLLAQQPPLGCNRGCGLGSLCLPKEIMYRREANSAVRFSCV